MPGAGRALLQRATFLAGADPWFSFPRMASSSNHSWGGGEEMGNIPTPARLPDTCCQELLALPDLHSQAPCSKHLSVPLPTVLVALVSSCLAIFPMGATGDRLSLPSSPHTGVCSKDHQGSCSEELKEKLHLPPCVHRAAQRASPNPTLSQQQDKSLFLESTSTRQGQLARIQPWKEQSLDFQHTEVRLQVQEDP